MVYLHRIYTKTGDDGDTSLWDGSRISKAHPRVRAMGAVDELNAAIGMAAVHVTPGPGLSEATAAELLKQLRVIQGDLFDVGADLAAPLPADESTIEEAGSRLRITDKYSTRLEQWIDRWNEQLAPLESFILPGGSPSAATLHWARTVCRQAESVAIELAAGERLNPQLIVYLNRLSDYLFITARIANDCGRTDVLWVPGASAGE
jgi:cob(I)alamin adenosyltransferase